MEAERKVCRHKQEVMNISTEAEALKNTKQPPNAYDTPGSKYIWSFDTHSSNKEEVGRGRSELRSNSERAL